MIDIENEIFTKIDTLLKTTYGNSFNTSSVYQNTPPSFPSVSIVEEDSYSDIATQDSESCEKCINVMYEINVYSNKNNRKKIEAKAIFTLINDLMISLGFTRQMTSRIPNVDNSIYRILGRYIAKVDKNKKIYRR